MMANLMECHCIAAAELPHMSRLYSTYVRSFPAVSEFYAPPPTFDAAREQAIVVQPDPVMRGKVAEILRVQNRQFGADATVEESLDRFAAGAAAVVSGQQVGLFSGPSYTIYKALSALGLAGEVNKNGRTAGAVFLLATADHGLAEI